MYIYILCHNQLKKYIYNRRGGLRGWGWGVVGVKVVRVGYGAGLNVMWVVIEDEFLLFFVNIIEIIIRKLYSLHVI